MKAPKTSPPPWTVLLLAATIAGAAGAAELSGRIELVTREKTVTAAQPAVIYFTPAAPFESPRPAAEPFEVVTVRKRFRPRVLAVPLGSTVVFPNQDQILHNVFSISGKNRFDLGLYRGGHAKEKVFESPGVVQVYCNVHHSMSAFVVVLETPYFTLQDPGGGFSLKDLPAGPGTLTVWHEQTEPLIREIELPTDDQLALRLEITKKRLVKHFNKHGKPYSRSRRGKAY